MQINPLYVVAVVLAIGIVVSIIMFSYARPNNPAHVLKALHKQAGDFELLEKILVDKLVGASKKAAILRIESWYLFTLGDYLLVLSGLEPLSCYIISTDPSSSLPEPIRSYKNAAPKLAISIIGRIDI